MDACDSQSVPARPAVAGLPRRVDAALNASANAVSSRTSSAPHPGSVDIRTTINDCVSSASSATNGSASTVGGSRTLCATQGHMV
jgi:hypothetical protein